MPPPKPPSSPHVFHSKSAPSVPTLKSLEASSGSNTSSATASLAPSTLHPDHSPSPDIITSPSPTLSLSPSPSPSEGASIEDFSLDSGPLLSDDEDGTSEEEEGEEHVGHLPPKALNGQHSKSYTYLAPSTFAPPFYGRPPTPLPPSPSLTSLLRPNFSSQNSRPTTPDPSSDEGTPNTRGEATGSQTPNSAAASTLTSSFRAAKPIPRASPRVPTYEYYGFTLYLVSSLAFIVYLFWSFLPKAFLNQLGIYYYPHRWWALAIPAWTVMFILYIYIALASYNIGYLTLSMDSVECLVDEAANVAIVDAQGKLIRDDKPSWHLRGPEPKRTEKGRKGGKSKGGADTRPRQRSPRPAQPLASNQELDWRTLWNEGTDAVMDIPIGGVCEILYGRDDKDQTDVRGNAHDR